MKPIVNALAKLSCGKRAYAVLVLCTATAIALPAQTFTTPSAPKPLCRARTAATPGRRQFRAPLGRATAQRNLEDGHQLPWPTA